MWQKLKDCYHQIPTLLWRVGSAVLLLFVGAFLLITVRGNIPLSPDKPLFLELPRDVKVFPLQENPSWFKSLPAISRTVKPYFGSNRIPIALIYHALRVWGPHASFAQKEVSPKWSGVKRDHLFLDILTDYQQYQQFSRFTVDRLLDRSPYGVRVVSADDAGWRTEWGSTHIGTYVVIMAEMGVPSTMLLRLPDGEATFLDVLRDESLRFDYSQELEWVCWGLPRYLTTPCWRNRFGENISLDDIAIRLTEREMGKGACFGTHVPMALAVLYGLNQSGARLIRQETEERLRDRLQQISSWLTRTQGSDGSWGIDWHHPGSQAPEKFKWYNRGINGSIITTGHHLEWMTHCPPQVRPRDDVLEAAALYLARNLPNLTDEIEYDFHVYAPATHAVRALLNICGHRWAKPEWLSGQGSSR